MALRDFKVIELLAAGFPIEEIAAREGISARRAREHAAAALARRTLDPPAHFAQLQIRRLSEALLVCTSAMSRGNLQAVDRVVKIVRELDRYHGFGPAAAAPRLTAPALPAPDSPAQLLAPPLALAPPEPANRRSLRRRPRRRRETGRRSDEKIWAASDVCSSVVLAAIAAGKPAR